MDLLRLQIVGTSLCTKTWYNQAHVSILIQKVKQEGFIFNLFEYCFKISMISLKISIITTNYFYYYSQSEWDFHSNFLHEKHIFFLLLAIFFVPLRL